MNQLTVLLSSNFVVVGSLKLPCPSHLTPAHPNSTHQNTVLQRCSVYSFLVVFMSILAKAALLSEESQYIITFLAGVTLNSSDRLLMGSCSLVECPYWPLLLKTWGRPTTSLEPPLFSLTPCRLKGARVALAVLCGGTSRLWIFMEALICQSWWDKLSKCSWFMWMCLSGNLSKILTKLLTILSISIGIWVPPRSRAWLLLDQELDLSSLKIILTALNQSPLLAERGGSHWF